MTMSGSLPFSRDRIYIVKDIIVNLAENDELNQTTLFTFCRLNLTKHKSIIDELESKYLISKSERQFGKRMVKVYKPTQKGIEFCRSILEPYEKMFPRIKSTIEDDDNRLAKYHSQQEQIKLVTNPLFRAPKFS